MLENKNKLKIRTKTWATLPMLMFILLFSGSHSSLMAQRPYEFSLYGGGAYSFLSHRSSKSNSFGYSVDAGLGFTYLIYPLWGIHVGAEFGFYDTQTKVNAIKHISSGFFDSNRYEFELHTTYYGYKEAQQAMFLSIPVLLQFQTTKNQAYQQKKGQKVGLYAMTGIKVSFLVKNSYQSQIDKLYNAGYYPFFDNWLDTQTFAGLGNFDGVSSSAKQSFRVLAIYTLEAGCKLLVGNSLFLYVGAYYDCGLHDPLKSNRQPLGYYADVENLADFTLLSFAKRVNYMAVGLKLRLTFTPSKSKKGMVDCPF